MELKELTESTLEIFHCTNTLELTEKLLDVCINNKIEYFEKFEELTEDLSVDWLQKIYQYHQADRKEKKQDFTPASLAKFVAQISGESEQVVDMCAGSGALAIQKWNLNHKIKFELLEIDENVIPYLMFNMVLRNIDCTIIHCDVLKNEVFERYRIEKGKKYGKVEKL